MTPAEKGSKFVYTILMNGDKSLTQTVVRTIYQGENMVDQQRFLVPRMYGVVSLFDFTVTLAYMDQGNNPQSEELVRADNECNEQFLCYYLPVGSKLTNLAGKVCIHLVFRKEDTRTLHSGETNITVHAVNPFYRTAGTNSGGSGDSSGEQGFEVVEF